MHDRSENFKTIIPKVVTYYIPASFSFIFVHYKHFFKIKTKKINEIQTQDAWVVEEHDDDHNGPSSLVNDYKSN